MCRVCVLNKMMWGGEGGKEERERKKKHKPAHPMSPPQKNQSQQPNPPPQKKTTKAVELQVDRVIQGKAQQDAEAARVRGKVEGLLTSGRDVVVYTTRALRQVRPPICQSAVLCVVWYGCKYMCVGVCCVDG